MATTNNTGTNGNGTPTEATLEPRDTIAEALGGRPVGGIHVLRTILNGQEQVVIRSLPLESPQDIPGTPKVGPGKRCHMIGTLSDLASYMADRKTDATVGFWSRSGVRVVINESGAFEEEVVSCTLDRHPSFSRWTDVCGKPLSQESLMQILRMNRLSIGAGPFDVATADFVTGAYASLKGELIHEADEFLDRKSRSATFTVRRKAGNGTKDVELPEIPTEFPILVKILQDDAEPTPLKVLVDMRGGIGAQIVFTLQIESLAEIVDDHLLERLSGFSESAGFLCVAGQCVIQPWTEAKLPIAIDRLMQLQAAQMAASNGQSFTLPPRKE